FAGQTKNRCLKKQRKQGIENNSQNNTISDCYRDVVCTYSDTLQRKSSQKVKIFVSAGAGVY
ncbi:hypothetical protein, partial [Vreelandella aquamarina]|uniref:hypothetical protein n=1 Tax=Vreelandella aquamarina TaxID=77097 RepID=UPI000AB83B01